MFLFQFLKHRQPPTAPQPGAAHTSGLVNWGWIFCPFGRGLVVSQRDMDSVVFDNLSYKLIEVEIIRIQFVEIIL